LQTTIYIGGVEKIDFGLSSWHPEGPPCHVSRQSENVFRDPDRWWNPLDSASSVITKVEGTVRTSALPFFDQRFQSVERILDEFERDYLDERSWPPERRLRILTPRQKIMAICIRLSRGERDQAQEVFMKLCSDRREASQMGIPERDLLVPSLLKSVANDAGFSMP
jgi:hypothetical protein